MSLGAAREHANCHLPVVRGFASLTELVSTKRPLPFLLFAGGVVDLGGVLVGLVLVDGAGLRDLRGVSWDLGDATPNMAFLCFFPSQCRSRFCTIVASTSHALHLKTALPFFVKLSSFVSLSCSFSSVGTACLRVRSVP